MITALKIFYISIFHVPTISLPDTLTSELRETTGRTPILDAVGVAHIAVAAHKPHVVRAKGRSKPVICSVHQ